MDNFSKKIKKLNQIKPDKEWLNSTRDKLETQIKFDQATNPQHDGIRFLNWLKQPQATALALCMSLIILGGPWLLVKASQASLPGEWLYSIKKANEGIQVRIASDYDRSQLQVEFASRRVEELMKIARNSFNDQEKSIQAQEIVANLRDNLTQASAYTNQLSKDEVINVAKQTQQIKKDLHRTKETASKQVQEELTKAEKAINQINQKILSALTKGEEKIQSEGNATSTDQEILIILKELEDGSVTTTDQVINGESK